MNPYRYPYGYHPAPPPVDPGGVTPITTNQQGVAMMAPHGYISAAPSPAYPVYYGGVGAVPLGGSVPPVATVPSTWGMHYGPGMAGVEYPAVTAMPGAYPSARPVTTRELTQFPSPGSESVSTTYMPYASRGEFVSLAAGNFGSPYVLPVPTSPPSVTRMSVGYVPGSSSEGVSPSTSSGDGSSAHQNSLEDQEVRDQLRQFRHMLEGLERRLDNRLRDSPQPRQPVASPPGFTAFPLAEPHPSLLVETPAAPPVPMESSVQPPAAFTMGQAREKTRDRCQWSCYHCHTECPCSLHRGSYCATGLHLGGVTLGYRDCCPSWAATGPPGEGVPFSEPVGLSGYPGSGESLRAARARSYEDAITSTAWQPRGMAAGALPP